MRVGIVIIVGVLLIHAGLARPRAATSGIYRQRCADGQRPSPCFVNPCWRLRCQSDSTMRCIPDYCNDCSRYWRFDNGTIGHCETVRRRG